MQQYAMNLGLFVHISCYCVNVLCSDFRAISRANVTKILVYMSPNPHTYVPSISNLKDAILHGKDGVFKEN